MNETLLPLVDRLKTSPTRKAGVTKDCVINTWRCFKQINLEHGDEATAPLLIALIVYDAEGFAGLLSGAEYDQLAHLASTALSSYQRLIDPPNKLGKLILETIHPS